MMATRFSALRGAIRAPSSALVRAQRPTAARVCCYYSTEHHYTGDTGEHHAHQDGMPKPRNFAAEIGDKMSPKHKQEPYVSSHPGQEDAHGKSSGKQWDSLEHELQDNEWDNIGNL
ncbi:hypothetical protein PG989_015647 [Apiospora arundinis]|uniref:Uncharacterized protein n=1 Tax=Apiospora arundinis TaxID=335852 RepID=A0ABR2JJJ4_9PEZI